MNKYIAPLICIPSLMFPFSVPILLSKASQNITVFYQDHKDGFKTGAIIALTAIPCIFTYPSYKITKHMWDISIVKHALWEHGIESTKDNGHYEKMVKYGLIAREKGLDGIKSQIALPSDVDSFKVLCTSNPNFADALAQLARVQEDDILMLRHLVILIERDE